MKELLFFILGMLIGGLFATIFMCCLQINKINKFNMEQNNKEENCENKTNKKTSLVK